MSIIRDVLWVAMGGQWDFSWAIWGGVTVLALVAAIVLATAARPVLDPVVVLVALHPGRCARWIVISLLGTSVAFALLVFSVLGAPFAVLGAGAAVIGTGIGYVAIGTILGDRILRAGGYELPAVIASLLGVAVLRCVRLFPFGLGALTHTLILVFSYAAICALSWDIAISWHRRRMPDNEQFAGENLIEWHAPGDENPPS